MILLSLIELDLFGAMGGASASTTAMVTGAAALLASGLAAGARRFVRRRSTRRPDALALALDPFEAIRAARAAPAPVRETPRTARATRRRRGARETARAPQRSELLAALEEASATAVLRLACTAPLRGLLEDHPRAAFARLQRRRSAVPLARRLEDARAATVAFLARVDGAGRLVRAEATAQPGSVAARLGRDAAPWARPVEAALAELGASFDRAQQTLDALQRTLAEPGAASAARRSHETDRSAPLSDSTDASGPTDAAAALVRAIDDVARADESLAPTALLLAPPSARRLARAVQRGAAALRGPRGDDRALVRALRSMRRELDR